ncbi:integrin alpha-2 isoform X2 [Pristis pectinata]|uniref:integrin alpha-2 isoform X2 n=1 Tax=Pristis pectinata TaxID=685728 RepID=UPI00223DC962|nr:integrin alpha-2 isoform X2 [Pristis pectinata]
MGLNTRGIVSFLLLAQGLLQASQAFNVDVMKAKTFSGPPDVLFGTSIQQFSNPDGQWLLVGSPWNGFPKNRMGDVYKCPISGSSANCEKLNLGDKMNFPNVTEVKQNMSAGATLVRNDETGGFLVCAPLWAQECGKQYYPTGLCVDVNSNFQISKTFSPAIQSCASAMDLVIVLDGSNSIWPWEPVQHFLKKLTGSLDIGPKKTQVSIVQYGENARIDFKLNAYKTTAEVEKIAANIVQKQGQETNTAGGIEFARKYAFSPENGGRPTATKVMVVVTDGESHDSARLPEVIAQCEEERIIRFGIAVLGYYNREGINPDNLIKEIKSIASVPIDKHFFNVSSEAALIEIAGALKERIFSIEGTSNKNEDTFLLEMAQVGFSAHIVPSQDLLILGAVGAYDWSGTTVHKSSTNTIIFSKKIFQDILQDRNDSTYLGYAVTSIVTPDSVLYVAGAPRFQHTGQIVIYAVGLNDKVLIKQTQKGEQLGSYFGSVLCSMDVNQDSLTDVLLVGSPMFMGRHKNEEGRVYVFSVNKGNLEKNGILEGPDNGRNNRFGAAIAAISDINLDGYHDVAVGAPVEDDNRGVVYIYNGYQKSIKPKHTQKIQASKISSQLQYFGLSIDGQKDLNGDSITDLSIGSIGNVVQLWSRSIANVSVTVMFEPTKLYILNKSCIINGNNQICDKIKICFRATIKPEKPGSSIDIRYRLTLDADLKSSRVSSRGLFQENHDRTIKKDITVGNSLKCNELTFYVQDAGDIVNPIDLRLDFDPQKLEAGPTLDVYTARSREYFVPFSKDCGEDEECITDLAIKVHVINPSIRTVPYIVSNKNKRITINVETVNKKENAFNAKVNIQFSENIFFASVDNAEVSCLIVDPQSVSCDIGHPFLPGGDKVSFDINFDFNFNEPKRDTYVIFHAVSESIEQPETDFDNNARVEFTVQYDVEILFSRSTNINFYEIHPDKQVPKIIKDFKDIGPEYVITLKVNTGHFPIQTAYVTVKIPVTTKGKSQLLYLTGVNTIPENNFICDLREKVDKLNIKRSPYSASFIKERLENVKDLNCENANCENFVCTMNNLAKNKEYLIYITTRIWEGTFINADFQSIALTPSAQIATNKQLLVIKNDTLTIPITLIKPVEKEKVPIGVIVGSIIGGLLVLLALVAALWKLGFFKRKYNKLAKDEEDDDNGNDKAAEE